MALSDDTRTERPNEVGYVGFTSCNRAQADSANCVALAKSPGKLRN